MKKIGIVMVLFLVLASSAFAMDYETAKDKCGQAFNAGYSCAVVPLDSPNVLIMNLQKPDSRWTYQIVKNYIDFDRYVNPYMISREVDFTLGKENFKAIVGNKTVKTRDKIFSELYLSDYQRAAKMKSAPTITYGLSDFWNVIDVTPLPEHPKPEAGCQGCKYIPAYSGTVYKDPLIK